MVIKSNKGEQMEELLRNYFLKAGYYVARGIPFNYEGFDVTDIDLWLYGRNSSVSREVAIVDIKNKKTPQAIERIFWVKGLQLAVHATNALVATTDKRSEVKDFGKEQGVLVLDGHFMSLLSRSDSILEYRFSEEELFSEIEKYTLGKLDDDWKGRVVKSKALLAKGLSFDSCNMWLEQGKYFAEQVITNPSHRQLAYRLCFLIGSYIAVSVDYILRELSFSERHDKEIKLNNGFRYGDGGRKRTKKIINASLALVEQFADNGADISNQVRINLNNELSELPINILSEYFSKSDVGKSLFSTSKELEGLAMAKDFSPHSSSTVETRAFIGCLLDYWGLDRREFSKKGA
jgi:hypothetical protein